MTIPQIFFAVLGLLIPIMAMFIAVLVAVRKDSKDTGRVMQQVTELALKLSLLDAGRSELLRVSDEKIANALEISNRVISQREDEIINAVKGFQQTVDDLRTEFASVRNMWQGERKIVTEIQALKMEFLRLHTEHDMNHPMRDSQRTMMQDSAPVDPWGEQSRPGCDDPSRGGHRR